MKSKNLNRRTFMKIGIGVISSFFGAILCWPLFSFLTSSWFKKIKKPIFIEVKGFESLAQGTPTKLYFQMKEEDAFLKTTQTEDIWVIKHSSEEATVFSPICPHLNCRYNWEKSLNEFVCPCHNSIFSEKGTLISGPAARGLDTLPHKIENGKLYIKWETFKPGIPQKIRV